jgi:DNA-binding transcriptional LysR family regulator
MEIDRFDLNLLCVLDMLREEWHVTRAAARLALTQPAVSAALVRLRAGFGDALLVLGGGGLVAKPRALELAPRVHTLMNEARAVLARAMQFNALHARSDRLCADLARTLDRAADDVGARPGYRPGRRGR